MALAIADGIVPSADDVLWTAKRCDAINEIESLVADDFENFYKPEKEGEDDGGDIES